MERKKNYKILKIKKKKKEETFTKIKALILRWYKSTYVRKKKINDHNDYFPIIKQIISNNVLGVYVYTHY